MRERELTALRLEMAANQRREVDEIRRELQVGRKTSGVNNVGYPGNDALALH